MDQSNPPKSGLPLPVYDPFVGGFALPRNLDAKLSDYGTPLNRVAQPASSAIESARAGDHPGGSREDENFSLTLRRQQPRFRDSIRGKLVGIAVGSSLASCATVPISYYLSEPTTKASPTAFADSDPQASVRPELVTLKAAFERLQAGKARGTVVLDLGHGSFMRDGKQINDPGARVVLQSRNGQTVIRDAGMHEKASDLGPGEQLIEENDIVQAMGARIALQMVLRGYSPRFTRHIDLEDNPYLKDLSSTERSILAALNSDVQVLSSRFDARIAQAQEADDGTRPAMYLVLHADKAPTSSRRGAGVFIHPDTPVNSASYRLSKSLQVHYRDATGGTLGPNVDKGVIPGQKGFGALFTPECTPEIGLGTRSVSIIDPNRGLGTISTALIEMGYLSNASDTYRLRNAEWATNFARVTAEGADHFFAREFEGATAPWKPTSISVNGKSMRVLPADPTEAAKVKQAMIEAIPQEKIATTTFLTRTVKQCKPSGVKYDVDVAGYGTMPQNADSQKMVASAAPASDATKPHSTVTAPRLEKPVERAQGSPAAKKPAPSKSEKSVKVAESPRRPADYAKRDERPRTRS